MKLKNTPMHSKMQTITLHCPFTFPVWTLQASEFAVPGVDTEETKPKSTQYLDVRQKGDRSPGKKTTMNDYQLLQGQRLSHLPTHWPFHMPPENRLQSYTAQYGNHWPHATTEHFKCGSSKWICVNMKYMTDFKGFVPKRMSTVSLTVLYINYILITY